MLTVKEPTAYVFKVAFNLNRRRLRRPMHGRAASFDRATTQDHASDVAKRADLLRAIGRLPRSQREALLLVEWVGLTAEEAGQVLKLEPSSIRVRMHRARAHLREALGGPDE